MPPEHFIPKWGRPRPEEQEEQHQRQIEANLAWIELQKASGKIIDMRAHRKS